MTTAADKQAKLEFIGAFFDELDEKAALTEALFKEGHQDEARLLCCCYIEALGNGLYPQQNSGAQAFSLALCGHSGDPDFSLVCPKWLLRSLPFGSASPAASVAAKEALTALTQNEALDETELLAKIGSIASDATEFLKREMWRGSVASAVYQDIRSLGVHWFGSPSSLSFETVKRDGKPLAEVGFWKLKNGLDKVIEDARRLSLASGKWFGHL